MDQAITERAITLLAQLGIKRTEITVPMIAAVASFVDEVSGSTAICPTCEGKGRVRVEMPTN